MSSQHIERTFSDLSYYLSKFSVAKFEVLLEISAFFKTCIKLYFALAIKISFRVPCIYYNFTEPSLKFDL